MTPPSLILLLLLVAGLIGLNVYLRWRLWRRSRRERRASTPLHAHDRASGDGFG